jgi:hypothetical protein
MGGERSGESIGRRGVDLSRLGMWAGILGILGFVVVVSADGATRSDGYDPVRHWVSLLSHGERGWLGTANLAVAGVLITLSSGAFLTLGRPRGLGPWVAVAAAGLGVSYVTAAVFPVHPAGSYPAGTGVAMAMSHSARVHGLAGVGIVVSLTAMCFAGARAHAREGRHRAAVMSYGCAAATGGSAVVCSVLYGLTSTGSWESALAGGFQRVWLVFGGSWFVVQGLALLRTPVITPPGSAVDPRPRRGGQNSVESSSNTS